MAGKDDFQLAEIMNRMFPCSENLPSRFVLMFVMCASPVLVVVCSAGFEGLSLHWAWLCFGSVPEC